MAGLLYETTLFLFSCHLLNWRLSAHGQFDEHIKLTFFRLKVQMGF